MWVAPPALSREEKPTLTPTRQLHDNRMVHVLGKVQGVGTGGAAAAVTTAAAAGVTTPWSAL